jgi:hypothetical protein
MDTTIKPTVLETGDGAFLNASGKVVRVIPVIRYGLLTLRMLLVAIRVG